MNVTVTDGTTTKTVPITTSYHDGAWMHFPISVPAGGIVRVTADKTAGNNAVIDGLFLGGAGTPPSPPLPPPPPPPPYETAPQGSWVGTYGVDGYALGGWTGPATGDLVSLPQATLTLEQGVRYNWDTAPTHRRPGASEPDGIQPARRLAGTTPPSSSCGSTSPRPTPAPSTSMASTGRTPAGG